MDIDASSLPAFSKVSVSVRNLIGRFVNDRKEDPCYISSTEENTVVGIRRDRIILIRSTVSS